MTDREKLGLRGPVRVCITEEVTYVRGWACGPDGCRPTGDPQERRTRSVDEYDIAGRLARQTYRDPEGRERTWENPAEARNSASEVKIDRHGRRVQITRVPAEFLSRSDTEYSHAIEGSDTCYSVRGAAVIETLLDEAGRPAEVTFLTGFLELSGERSREKKG